MKTDDPLILTPRFADRDIEYFDRLRSAYFPSARNFLRAHLTMFHRLPGEYGEQIGATLDAEARRSGTSRSTSPHPDIWERVWPSR